MTASPPVRKGRIFLQLGFRPFFLAAAAWLVIALGLWLAVVSGHLRLPLAIPALLWHWHEMLFGFVAATMAGFVLTAVPNWTGGVPIRGARLAALVALWLAGRLALLFSGVIGLIPAGAIDVAFLAVLAAVVGREIVLAGNRRNLVVVAGIGLLGAANAIFYLDAAGFVDAGGVGRRLAFAAIIFLIVLIGGRILPAFTGNWLAARGESRRPVSFNRFDAATVAVTGLGLSAWTAAPDHPAAGWLLMICAGLHAVRLARWRGWLARREPLVLVLHVAYGWLVPGLALLGAAILTPAVPMAAALHALGAGLMGSMIAAVMTRASLGHGGRPLSAGAGTRAIFILVFAGAALRVVSAFVAPGSWSLLAFSGLAWGGGYALFAVVYGPMMFRTPNP